MKHKVSIVIIGRNEQHGIGKCIEAAQAAAEQIGGAEMIYVDSNSTDETVAVVKSYRNVRVLSLSSNFRPSPSAGRFMGSLHATGEFILFLDADTLVAANFLPTAIKHLENEPALGGINGYIDDLNDDGERLTDIEERPANITKVKWLRGPCCFYRRKALFQVGSFNPELATEEEAELGLRLVRNGWKLKIIPLMMACHTRCFHGQSLGTILSTFRRDIRSRRLGEMTKTIAYAFRAGNGLAFCWLRFKTTILFLAWLFAIAICGLLPEPRFVILGFVLLGGLAIFAKKRSLYQTALFLPAKLLNVIDLLSGLQKIRIHRVEYSQPHKPQNDD